MRILLMLAVLAVGCHKAKPTTAEAPAAPKPTEATKPKATPAPPVAPKPAPTPEPEPAPAPIVESDTIDGLRVQFAGAGYGRNAGPVSPKIEVYWVASTTNDDRKYDVRQWGTSLIGNGDAVATDDKGNTYRASSVDYPRHDRDWPDSEKFNSLSRELSGRKTMLAYGSGAVTSETALWGAIYFDRPVKTATEMKVRLIARNARLRGEFVFKFTPGVFIELNPPPN